MDSTSQIRVIGANKRITEIPRMIRKNIIRYCKPQCPQVLNEKYRSRPGIALLENVNLSQLGNKHCKI